MRILNIIARLSFSIAEEKNRLGPGKVLETLIKDQMRNHLNK